MLTIDQLKIVSPHMAHNPNTCEDLFPHLLDAMEKACVNTDLRVAMFVAQTLHETGEYRYFQEIWGPTPQQLKYEPPSELATRLGNTEPGDGKLFKGHGAIQLTGRANHKHCGDVLGVDFIKNPELAASKEWAFRVAGWFWDLHELNTFCDTENLLEVTKRINGGTNGLESRQTYYERAKQALGLP